MALADRFSRHRLVGDVLLAAGTLALVSAPPIESQLIFNPQIQMSASRTDNAFFSPDAVGEAREDAYYSLGVTLPLSQNLSQGSLDLTYSARADRFEEFDELDNLSHDLSFGFSTQMSSTSGFNLGLGYSLSEDHYGGAATGQIDLDDLDEPLFFLTERIQRENATARVGFTHGFSTRLSGQLSANYRMRAYDDIEGDQASTDTEDRDDLGARVGMSMAKSPYTSLAVRYGVRGFGLDLSGETLVHSLGFGVDREIEDRFSVSFELGVFQRSFQNEAEAEVKDDAEGLGIQGSFSARRTLQRYSLGFSASHEPSAGDVFAGSSTDSQASFSLSPLYLERWSWGVSLSYGHREPVLEGMNAVDFFGAAASVHRSLGRMLGLSLSSSLRTQTEQGGEEQDIAVAQTSFSLIFYPLARSARSGALPVR